jgi:hypothetical protein
MAFATIAPLTMEGTSSLPGEWHNCSKTPSGKHYESGWRIIYYVQKEQGGNCYETEHPAGTYRHGMRACNPGVRRRWITMRRLP